MRRHFLLLALALASLVVVDGARAGAQEDGTKDSSAEVVSPAPGEQGLGYPLVVVGRAVRARPVWDPAVTVHFKQDQWEFDVTVPVSAEGDFVASFDPRLLRFWAPSELPWSATVSTRAGTQVVPLTTATFFSAPIDKYCFGYAVTVDLEAGDMPTDGQDIIVGTEGNDRIFSGDGNDVICALGGIDRVFSGDGNDVVSGGDNRDVIVTGNGNDRVIGGAGADRIKLGHGDDFADGGTGRDQIRAGVGEDRILGGRGVDTLFGGGGNDFLNGGGQRSSLDGGVGSDLCVEGIMVSCEVPLVPAP